MRVRLETDQASAIVELVDVLAGAARLADALLAEQPALDASAAGRA